MSARQHRARRDRRRARGVRGATLCVVYGVNVPKFYSKLGVERPIHVRTSRGFDQYACRETLCNLLEINSTSLFLITEMLTRGALLVPRLKLKSTSLCRQWDRGSLGSREREERFQRNDHVATLYVLDHCGQLHHK